MGRQDFRRRRCDSQLRLAGFVSFFWRRFDRPGRCRPPKALVHAANGRWSRASSELLVIGGASGAGKSSTAVALHDILSAQDVQHAVVEGDALDLAHPAPWRSGIAFRSLSAIYRELGFRRLIFTNTVSVLDARSIADAMSDQPRVTAILLQTSSFAIEVRLGKREQGESLAAHVERMGVGCTESP